jgi:hypothetical protein
MENRLEELVTELEGLNEEVAQRLIPRVMAPDTPLYKIVRERLDVIWVEKLNELLLDDPKIREVIKETQTNFVKIAIKHAVKEVIEQSEISLKPVLTEVEVCKLLRKEKQFLKTRRSKGQSVPPHQQLGNNFVYLREDVMEWAQEMGLKFEPVSKLQALKRGLKVFSFAISTTENEIEKRKRKFFER